MRTDGMEVQRRITQHHNQNPLREQPQDRISRLWTIRTAVCEELTRSLALNYANPRGSPHVRDRTQVGSTGC